MPHQLLSRRHHQQPVLLIHPHHQLECLHYWNRSLHKSIIIDIEGLKSEKRYMTHQISKKIKVTQSPLEVIFHPPNILDALSTEGGGIIHQASLNV